MNSIGEIRPSLGCSQRISASARVDAPVAGRRSAGREVDLAAVEGPARVRSTRARALAPARIAGLGELRAAAAGGLGAVHRDVGEVQQLVRVLADAVG